MQGSANKPSQTSNGLFWRPVVLALGLAIGLTLAPNVRALTLEFKSDNDFLGNAAFNKLFGANVRWGNNASNGDWEWAVVDAGDVPTSLPGQQDWTDATTHDAGLAYLDTLAAQLTLSNNGNVFADTGPQSVAGTPAINALAVRARTGDGDTAKLSNLFVEFDVGGSVNLGTLEGDGDAEYLMLVDSRLAGGFTVSAAAELADGGQASTNGSIPMYGFKVGISTVPVPAAAWLFGSALALLAGLRKRLR